MSVKHGVRGGYRHATGDERLLAVLRVESGTPIEIVAADFDVSVATGAQKWFDTWRDGIRWGGEISTFEAAAGYILAPHEDVADASRVKRGPQWSQQRAATAAHALALECLVAAIADQKTIANPTAATIGAIRRVYRCLDTETQATFAPVWDLCQLALDELEAARTKLTRAIALSRSLRPVRESEAA